MAQESRREIAYFAGSALLAFAAGGNSLANPYVLDDITKVQSNPDIRSLRNLPRSLVYAYEGTGERRLNRNDPSRPLTFLSYTLNYCLLGQEPWHFRAVNICGHLACSWGVRALVRALLSETELRGDRQEQMLGGESDEMATPAGRKAHSKRRPLGTSDGVSSAVLSVVVARPETEAARMALLVADMTSLLFLTAPIAMGTATYIYGRSEVFCSLMMILALRFHLQAQASTDSDQGAQQGDAKRNPEGWWRRVGALPGVSEGIGASERACAARRDRVQNVGHEAVMIQSGAERRSKQHDAFCLLCYLCALGFKQIALCTPLLAVVLDLWKEHRRRGMKRWEISRAARKEENADIARGFQDGGVCKYDDNNSVGDGGKRKRLGEGPKQAEDADGGWEGRMYQEGDHSSIYILRSASAILRQRRWAYGRLGGVSCLFLMVRLVCLGGLGDLEADRGVHPYGSYIAQQPWAALKYFQLSLLPIGLAIDHDLRPSGSSQDGAPEPLRSLSLLLPIIVTAHFIYQHATTWGSARSERAPSSSRGGGAGGWSGIATLGIAWFCVCLLPTSMLPTVDLVVERRAYLACVGLFFVVAWGLWRMGNGGSEGGGGGKAAVQQVGVRICVVVVVFQTLVCRQRNSLFAREEDVWGEVLALYPRSVRGRHNLGTLLIRRQPPPDAGDLRRAQELFVGLLSDDATDVYALNNLGALHNDASPAVVAAGLYAPERAHDLLVQARHLQPASPAAHYNLGLLHHQQAFRTRREREGSAVAVQRGGEAEARAPRAELTGAITAEEKRHLTQAEQMYRVTLGLDPRHVLARNNLGLVFFRLSRYDEAEREYLAALEQNPQHSDVKANLALLRKAQSAA